MPLLHSIVAEFDRELDRLHALRSIVAGLGRTPKAVAQLIASPATRGEQQIVEPVLPETRTAKAKRKTRADAGKPRSKRVPKKKEIVQQARAFATTIPSGPVVLNPARLAEEKARRKQERNDAAPMENVPAALDLDALARSMAAQWGTSPVQ